MHDPKILQLIALRLSAKETLEDKEELDLWLQESTQNVVLFSEVQKTWQDGGGSVLSFRKKFTKKYLIQGLIQETLGSLVGLGIGLWVSNSFTHYARERKSIKNLYGVLGRKKYVVNEIPEWMQFCISVLLGFIALELINYFFQSKSHLTIWRYLAGLAKEKSLFRR